MIQRQAEKPLGVGGSISFINFFLHSTCFLNLMHNINNNKIKIKTEEINKSIMSRNFG